MATAEWKRAKLDELGFVGRGKSRYRPRNAAFLYGGRYPFFQTGDIKAANFHLTEYSQTYSEEGLAQSKLWKPGTLCITIAANIAESAILGVEGCFPDSVVGFVADPNKSDVRFIKYYMEILKLHMQSVSRGTTQDNLSVDKLLSFDFLVPPLSVQRRIAGILSAYDELIENSQRRIKILESMARALYREWFVHFRFPGHEKLACVASPVGDIPQGWEVKKLGDIAEDMRRNVPKGELEEPKQYVGLEHIPRRSLARARRMGNSDRTWLEQIGVQERRSPVRQDSALLPQGQHRAVRWPVLRRQHRYPRSPARVLRFRRRVRFQRCVRR